ncbi:MAG TPA: DNA polymerase [Bacteroidales bacterium]|nr:DNA polymerase [Bacteroidales bacterium]
MNYILVYGMNVITKKQLHDAFDYLFERDLITFDIETNTLDRFSDTAKLISFAIQADDNVYGFKVYNRNDDLDVEYTPEEAIQYLKLLLEDTNIIKVGHNLKFDLSFLHVVYNFDKSIFTNIQDTILLSHLVDENIPLNLDHQCQYYLDIPKHKSMVDNTKLETEKLSLVLKYNMIDVDKTFQLFNYLYPIIKKQTKVFNAYTKEKLKLVYSLSKMENNGFPLDIELLQEYKKQFAKDLHILQNNYIKNLVKETGDKKLLSIKLTEADSLKSAFIKLGFKLTHLTKGGIEKEKYCKETGREFIPTIKELTLDFNALEDLLKIPKNIKDKKEYQRKLDLFVIPLIKFREDYKIYSTYLKGLLERISDDCKIHASYNITGTVTGRLSSSNPNMQNIPRDSIVKNLFYALDDYVLVEFDYSQGELRVLAVKSGDKVFIDAFNSGEDIHKKTAAMMFRIDIKDVQKWQRQIAKSINFGLVYGMSAKALYETLIGIKEIYDKVMDENDDFDMSEEIAQEYINEYFRIYKGVKAYLDKVVRDSIKNGYSETCCGQRRHFEDMIEKYNNGQKFMYGKIERQSKNAPIQGTLGQIMNYNISRITEYLEFNNMRSVLIGTVHDSLMGMVHKSELKYYINDVKQILETIPKSFMDTKGVPFAVDFKIGQRWGEMCEAELLDNKIKLKEK